MHSSSGGPSPLKPTWDRLAQLSQLHPWRFVLGGCLLFLLAAPFAGMLYADLRTDLRELLPRGAPAAVAIDELEQRVGGLSHLTVVIDTQDFEAGKKFVDALGAALQPLLGTMASEIRWKNDDDREFIEKHGALVASLADLTKLRDGIASRVKSAKQAANPLMVDLDEDDDAKKAAEPEKPIELDAEAKGALDRLRKELKNVERFRDGYLADEAGHTLVLLVTPNNAAIGLDLNQRLFNAVDGEVKKLDPRSFHPSMRVGYDGEVREVIEAQEHLVSDLKLSSILTLLAVGAVLFLYFRTVWSIPILVGPMFCGAAITFAIARPVILALNPNTAFLGSIIIGNGINAGVILLARYLEERRHGLTVAEALPKALEGSWIATLAAGSAAAASYASLGATAFRGFNQFAFIGALGMILCWITTYAFAPSMVVLFERWRPLAEPGERKGLIAAPLGRLIVRSPMAFGLVALAITTVAVIKLVPYAKSPIEYDFSKLGSKQGKIDGAAYWSARLDAVMQSYQTPTVILTENAERADAVAAALEVEKARQGKDTAIDSILTLDGLVAKDQAPKIAVLKDIFEQLTPRVIDALPEDLRPITKKLKERTELRVYDLADLPLRSQKLFKEKGGQTGRIVLVYPTLGATAENGRAQLAFARSLRETAQRTDPKSYVAGSLILMADIVETITRDGFFATGLSFVMVAVLTLIMLRGLFAALWTMASLTLGTLWLGGALGLLSLKLNFVNFVVLPITFGIGIDYAVNLYQRYRQDGDVAGTVASSGGAVALCSSTTIIGYAALLLADNRAIFSFGATAVLGEITTLSAAVIALPAFLAWRERARRP
ncbi:MAG: MMPL family transporter [Deltaproteobacteria bacterium]|nr:MMPL family transporter [Deltaproteobacteria bacterium]